MAFERLKLRYYAWRVRRTIACDGHLYEQTDGHCVICCGADRLYLVHSVWMCSGCWSRSRAALLRNEAD